jgi:hypothetical protein
MTFGTEGNLPPIPNSRPILYRSFLDRSHLVGKWPSPLGIQDLLQTARGKWLEVPWYVRWTYSFDDSKVNNEINFNT